MDITIRPLETLAEYRACVALQQETWGRDFREAVPPAILMIARKLGGVVAGAFDAAGTMVGFVFGITGVKQGSLGHWSHMLAVKAECRDQDVGRRLKQYQRSALLESGVEVMWWTYDPLVARNAHVNLTTLGVEVVQYVPDMYGSNEDSSVDSVIGTDRFIVEWNLLAEHGPAEACIHRTLDEAPVVNVTIGPGDAVVPHVGRQPEAAAVHVVVPRDIQALKESDPSTAQAWRRNTRTTFQWYLDRGYRIASFMGSRSSAFHFYCLHRGTEQP